MQAKFGGTCSACGVGFGPGTTISYDRKAPKGHKARHLDCSDPQASTEDEDERDDRRIHQRGGWTGHGRCIDAPCCGCCE